MTKPYQEISLYHPDYGIKTKTKQEFIYLYGLSYRCIDYLRAKRLNTHKGWVLAENKENYQELIKVSRGTNNKGTCGGSLPRITMTLEHPELGRHTLFATEFVRQFGLDNSTLCQMRYGKIKKHRGWTIPANTD